MGTRSNSWELRGILGTHLALFSEEVDVELIAPNF